jgi:hypothetical protein
VQVAPSSPGRTETRRLSWRTLRLALRAVGAAIAGTVRNRAGNALRRAVVQARNRSTGERFFASTNRSGHFRLRALTSAADGYAVCFAEHAVRRAPTGYLDECWKNHPWSSRRIPTDTAPVSVHVGKTRTRVNAVLAGAGAVAGKLTDAHTGYPIFSAITVFNCSGRVLARTGTGQPTCQSKGLASGAQPSFRPVVALRSLFPLPRLASDRSDRSR